MKLSIFSKYLLFGLIFIYSNIYAQDSLIQLKNQIKQDRDALFIKKGQKTVHPNYYSNSHTFLDLKIEEIIDSIENFHRFSNDLGDVFGYCGDILGGIKNLLQTSIWTTPHLRFLNEPIEKRYIRFWGQGWNLKGSKTKDSSACYTKDLYFDVRDMMLKIMAQRFDFEVKETQDSLEYLELRVIDSTKLIVNKTILGDCDWGGGAKMDSLTKTFVGYCGSLLWISVQLEQKWNIYNEDETHTLGTYFNYKIPFGLLESYEKLPQLTAYLEENLGLTIRKTKKLETVYFIKFLK